MFYFLQCHRSTSLSSRVAQKLDALAQHGPKQHNSRARAAPSQWPLCKTVRCCASSRLWHGLLIRRLFSGAPELRRPLGPRSSLPLRVQPAHGMRSSVSVLPCTSAADCTHLLHDARGWSVGRLGARLGGWRKISYALALAVHAMYLGFICTGHQEDFSVVRRPSAARGGVHTNNADHTTLLYGLAGARPRVLAAAAALCVAFRVLLLRAHAPGEPGLCGRRGMGGRGRCAGTSLISVRGLPSASRRPYFFALADSNGDFWRFQRACVQCHRTGLEIPRDSLVCFGHQRSWWHGNPVSSHNCITAW